MRYNQYDDHDGYDYEPYNYEQEEERERQAYLIEKARLTAMSPEDLGKQWQRHCNRHDSAVDRCEEINSPTIEDAQGWMTFIEKEFERRGIDRFKYTLGED